MYLPPLLRVPSFFLVAQESFHYWQSNLLVLDNDCDGKEDRCSSKSFEEMGVHGNWSSGFELGWNFDLFRCLCWCLVLQNKEYWKSKKQMKECE